MADEKMVPTERELGLGLDARKAIEYDTGEAQPESVAEGLSIVLASYRAELARDPAFVLAAAQDLLDGVDGGSGCTLYMDVSGVPVGSLLDVYELLLAARQAGGK